MPHPPSAQRPSHTRTWVAFDVATWCVGGATGRPPLVRTVNGREGGEIPILVFAVTYT